MAERLVTPKVKVITTREYEVKLTRDMILSMLRSNTDFKIADDAKVVFHVPGGGDWSDADIEVDEFHPITIQWETTDG